tara:strand:- start:138 stop:521 length:384 start_codon:yes stop_codon:yes gene_type:complete
MWGTYPFKAISVADRKIKGLERFKLVIEDKNYGGTYLVKTKNLIKCDEFKYGKGWVIDVEDFNVLEPYIPPTEHDKMNIKDSLNNIINSVSEMPKEEELATYEEISQMCKEAKQRIEEISRVKSLAV